MSLQQLHDSIVADGKVDAGEVDQLIATLFDSSGAGGFRVTLDEAVLVQEIKDAVGDNAPLSFGGLYVGAMTAAVTGDDGWVDVDEVAWLRENVTKDGQVDQLERVMLLSVKASADGVSDGFDELLA